MSVTVEPRRLWFGLTGAPAAWVVQGLCGWAFGARICTELPIGRVRLLVAALSGGALIVAAAAVAVALGNWRRVTSVPRAIQDRVEFMSFGGVFVSAAFLVGICWAGLNAVFINVCGGTR